MTNTWLILQFSSCSQALVYCNESLVSGRLDALVGNLVPTADCYPDRAFLFAFLLASRLFIKPHDLLGQISSRCQVQMQDSHKTETDELCGSAECMAQQLTHIELERLSYIGAEEFVQTFAIQTPLLDPSYKDPRITTNYEVYLEWSTRLKRLVITDIVRHIKSKKQRVRIVEYWVDTAKECFNIGNFNSLMAIIAGLNTVPVSRLKRTWCKSEVTEQFTILDNQMSSLENYASYKALLRAAAARFNKDDKRLCIVIPVFTLLAKEIHNLCDQCLQKLPNGHINFEKFWQLAKHMTEFITWKQIHCPFPKTAKVITYLQATPVLNDEGALLASFDCEPPQTDYEKDLYEKLL
ncbi:unnamed protein product [Nesidiocoris tenuis]|uniref:Ras-GEF domain-containing protein n=1 Tax=Nesidiocoris tenuis TaxID=355587 RepID=A0A6H5H9X8_9HEMI|nr:unnamed protein product [Nesidiocoris tenuis]